MAESLGEKLRQAREEKGISISEVAEQTRISPIYLESIENDDYRTLPGGIFNKGFIKSFAKYVGVDEQEAMQDYAQLSASQVGIDDQKGSKSYRPEVLTDDSSGPSMLPTIILAAIILGLMTWGILALVNYLKDSQSQVVENNIANNNTKVIDDNTNTNTNTQPEAIPDTDSIKVQIKTTAPELSLTTVTDGKREVSVITPEMERTVEGKESVILNYYKGLADTVLLTVNGKKIETPIPPASYRKNGFEFQINMDNIKQILQSGKIDLETAPIDQNANVNNSPK
ncbi:MAG: helix-turn-helix domain-containing protein [Acidobacteria bacterium]|nr:helix-turn-helix domain-containing protein [Acidobacteriota bacterium]